MSPKRDDGGTNIPPLPGPPKRPPGDCGWNPTSAGEAYPSGSAAPSGQSSYENDSINRIICEALPTFDFHSFPGGGVPFIANVTNGLTMLLANVFIEYERTAPSTSDGQTSTPPADVLSDVFIAGRI